ncbi:MAG: ketopantoate reductase family protein [Promethearchaeia archaeon]
MKVKDVVIYGTGAIGSVLATFLRQSDPNHKRRIHLIGRSYILDPIKEGGLYFIPYDEDQKTRIHTAEFQTHTDISEVPHADVIFFSMKAHSLKKSLEDAKHLLKTNPTVFITMNGLGLTELVSDYVSEDHIIQCIVLFPSKLNGNVVKNTGGNATIIAEKNDISSELVPKLFKSKTLDIPLDENYKEAQWKKAVMNIGMNAISAITMKTVGEVLETAPLRKIIEKLIEETLEIAQKEGIRMPENMKEQFWEFCSNDPHHRPSTQQDIKRGKPTEIEFLNGYIFKKGKEYNINTPANSAIISLMDIIESSKMK